MTTRFLLRGGTVLTLGAKTANHAEADVLIDDGKVAEIGPGLRARDAELVDATDTIVMPGFVDTHRHAWRSLFRNLGEYGSSPEMSVGTVGEHYGPEDVYAATLIGLLGAVEAGITTVVDWAELALDDASADAALQAHRDAGLRTVLVPGTASRHLLERVTQGAGPSTSVAVGAELVDPGRTTERRTVARDLGARLHIHAAEGIPGAVARLAVQDPLGADVTLVHGAGFDEADLDAIRSSGAAVSLTPSSEMAGGLGSLPIQELIDRDIRPGLGIGDEQVAPGDLFAQMRATISLQHATVFDRKLAGKAGLPKVMSTRDVIRSATVDGARVAGVDAVTGSIELGKQADLILLRTDRPNIFPINDPIGAVVWGMDTSNVDWVFVGGRVVMREGHLQGDVQRARSLATAARQRVAESSGLVVGASTGGER